MVIKALCFDLYLLRIVLLYSGVIFIFFFSIMKCKSSEMRFNFLYVTSVQGKSKSYNKMNELFNKKMTKLTEKQIKNWEKDLSLYSHILDKSNIL
jgi:hypothetical protein